MHLIPQWSLENVVCNRSVIRNKQEFHREPELIVWIYLLLLARYKSWMGRMERWSFRHWSFWIWSVRACVYWQTFESYKRTSCPSWWENISSNLRGMINISFYTYSWQWLSIYIDGNFFIWTLFVRLYTMFSLVITLKIVIECEKYAPTDCFEKTKI